MRPIIGVTLAGLSFPVLSTGHSATSWPRLCHDTLLMRGQRPAQEGGPDVADTRRTGQWASQRPAGHMTSLTTRLPMGAAHFREAPEGIRGQHCGPHSDLPE